MTDSFSETATEDQLWEMVAEEERGIKDG